MNKTFLILPVLLMSITGCSVYISPDSATITKRPRPQKIPSATIPSAYPNYTNPTITSPPTTAKSTRQVQVTEIQGTPSTKTVKKASKPAKTRPALKLTQTHYTVKPYDTVFSIMRTTNANWSDIIRINSLEPPNYTIHPGQVLRLK